MSTRPRLPIALLCALGLAACTNSVKTGDSAGSTGSMPTVSLNSAPSTVAPGGSTLLSWTSSNAAGCNAGGAWAGAKTTSGQQTISSIQVTSVYSMTCTNTQGSTTSSTTVTVGTGAGVNGVVDSSLVARHQESANLVSAFAGFNTTAGTPVATAPVTQDTGACTFRYSMALANGNYTVALTSDGGATFKRSANVTVAGTAVQDFTPTRILRVGPARAFTDPSQVTGLQNGDVIEIDAGTYNNTEMIWPSTISNLTLRGVGGRAHMVAPATISNGKGIWVTQAANMKVENIEFSGAAIPVADNGAGIRSEGQDLAICGSYFHDNENGILGNSNNGNVLIEYSEFGHNGTCSGPGCAHNMYIGNTARFTLRYSYSHHASSGHLVKSRALENYILYNRIMDEANGNSSYSIDLPDGGLSYIIGNLLQQGPNTENSAIVAYGAESLSNPVKTLYVVNNTIVNDRPQGATFVQISGGSTVAATVQNNLFVNNGTPVSGGTTTQTSNLQTNAPNFVDIANFNYRPTATTPGINQGTAPGVGGTFALTPIYQYVHPTNREPRPTDSAMDIGAYEYVP